MIHLALTVFSFLFLCAVAVAALWCAAWVIGGIHEANKVAREERRRRNLERHGLQRLLHKDVPVGVILLIFASAWGLLLLLSK